MFFWRRAQVIEAARRAVAQRYPELAVTDAFVRGRDRGRPLVFVFVEERARRAPRTNGPRFKIFAVRRDLSCDELPLSRSR